jgi:hypothetical protein
MSTLRAWRIDLWDVTTYVAATSRAKAKYMVAAMAADAWYCGVGEAFPDATCKRAPEWDHAAAAKGTPGSLHPLEQWQPTA